MNNFVCVFVFSSLMWHFTLLIREVQSAPQNNFSPKISPFSSFSSFPGRRGFTLPLFLSAVHYSITDIPPSLSLSYLPFLLPPFLLSPPQHVVFLFFLSSSLSSQLLSVIPIFNIYFNISHISSTYYNCTDNIHFRFLETDIRACER